MRVKIIAAAVAVATTDEVANINVENATSLGLELKNVGANALDALEVWGTANADGGTYSKLLGLAADYTTPIYPLIKASASPVTLASAAGMWMVLNVAGFSNISLRASAITGVTTLDIRGVVKA